MRKIYTILLSALFLVGCNKTIEKQYIHDFYTTEVAAVIVHEGIINPGKETTVTTKYKRADCPECKGTGIIVSGDGIHKQTCPYCEVPKNGLVGNLLGDDKCCSHCICNDCKCEYPGQCLIEKNAGWPVKICSGDVCETYYPLNDKYEPYDPFLLLTKEQQKSKIYEKFKNPILINSEGNEIKEK